MEKCYVMEGMIFGVIIFVMTVVVIVILFGVLISLEFLYDWIVKTLRRRRSSLQLQQDRICEDCRFRFDTMLYALKEYRDSETGKKATPEEMLRFESIQQEAYFSVRKVCPKNCLVKRSSLKL